MRAIGDLRGVIVPLVTPFDGDEELDPDALRQLVEFLINGGIHGLMACGTTGETPLLTAAERLDIIRVTVEQAGGRIPVIAQVGTATTGESVSLARDAVALGADALAVLTPFYYRYSAAMLLEHYATVCAAVPDCPVFLYNIPQYTGNDLTASLVAQIVAECPNVVGLKESSGDLGRCWELLDLRDGAFQVVIGNDELALPAMKLGVQASVSGNANVFPELFVSMYEAYWKGDEPTAHQRQQRIRAVCTILQNGRDLSLFKELLARRGIPVGGVRPPLRNASSADVDAAIQRLAKVGQDIRTGAGR